METQKSFQKSNGRHIIILVMLFKHRRKLLRNREKWQDLKSIWRNMKLVPFFFFFSYMLIIQYFAFWFKFGALKFIMILSNGQIFEIKNHLRNQGDKIFEIKNHSTSQTNKFLKLKNHLTNQTDKFWKWKNHFRNQMNKTKIKTYNYFNYTSWTS